MYDHEFGQCDIDYLAINVAVYEGQESGCMNSEQRIIYDEIVSAIYNVPNEVTQTRNNFSFVDGPGGTGKTFLYNALLARVCSNSQIASACAPSKIAATLLPGS